MPTNLGSRRHSGWGVGPPGYPTPQYPTPLAAVSQEEQGPEDRDQRCLPPGKGIGPATRKEPGIRDVYPNPSVNKHALVKTSPSPCAR